VPAYITWEQYEANRRRMRENDLCGGNNTATGKAPTLLNGLIACGRCGRPMSARNARASAVPRYVCDAAHIEYGEPVCQGV
jgi:hypothetical protein